MNYGPQGQPQPGYGPGQPQPGYGQQPPNPYAAPAAGGPGYGAAPGPGGEYFRQGDNLVVRKNTVLPDVCIATGQPTGGNAVSKKLTWVPPWVGILFVLISPIIGIIVMLVVRKSGSFTYFLTQETQSKRKTGVLIGVGLIVASVLMFIAGGMGEMVALLLLGFVAFIAGIIVAVAVGVPFRVTKIDENYIYLKVKPAFWAGMG